MIKNIILDVGMVLVWFRPKEYMREDLGFDEKLIEAFQKKMWENDLWHELDLGVRSKDEVLSEMRSELKGFESEMDRFFADVEKIVRPYSYSRDWIKELKSRGYMVYLLSNYPDWMFELHARTQFDFMDIIDGKVVSGYEKLTKPDPAIYQLLFSRYHLDPAECVFLDDSKPNIETALELGMKGIVFTSYENATIKLNALLKDAE